MPKFTTGLTSCIKGLALILESVVSPFLRLEAWMATTLGQWSWHDSFLYGVGQTLYLIGMILLASLFGGVDEKNK